MPFVAASHPLDAAAAAHSSAPFDRTGAHLAGYSFQFDCAQAETADASGPPAGTEWTLPETLAEIERRGAQLRLGSGGVRLVHAHRLPGLARAVALHEADLAVWIRLGLDRGDARLVPFGATAWDATTRLHAAWFVCLFEVQPGRVPLRPGVMITDMHAFRESVAGRLAVGPDAAGADGLRADLAALYERFGREAGQTAVPAPARARAA